MIIVYCGFGRPAEYPACSLRANSQEVVQASVYNVNAKQWIPPSEPVDDIEQGKERAAAYAKAYLRHTTNADLPTLKWKKSRSQ